MELPDFLTRNCRVRELIIDVPLSTWLSPCSHPTPAFLPPHSQKSEERHKGQQDDRQAEHSVTDVVHARGSVGRPRDGTRQSSSSPAHR